MDLPLLHISHNWNPTLWDLLCLASLTWHHVFEIHPHDSICQYFTPFFLRRNNIITYYVNATVCLSILLLVNVLYCFQFRRLWMVLLWICMRTYLFEQFSFLLCLPRCGMTGMINSTLNFLRNHGTVFPPQRLSHLQFPPAKGCVFSISPNLCPHPFSGFCTAVLLGVEGHLLVVLISTFVMIDVEHLFMCLLASLGKCLLNASSVFVFGF